MSRDADSLRDVLSDRQGDSLPVCTALDVPNMGTREGGRIRTSEVVRRLGYSQDPLAAWVTPPLEALPADDSAVRPPPQLGRPGRCDQTVTGPKVGAPLPGRPSEHSKFAADGVGGWLPVLGRFAIEFSKTMHTRLLLVEASVRCGSPSGRCSRFAVQARRPAVEPEGRDRPVGADRGMVEEVGGQAAGCWN